MSERRLNDLQRYQQYQSLLTLPTFDTIEAAEGHLGRFLLRQFVSSYAVCDGYVGQSRDAAPAWTHREEYVFSHHDIYAAKQRAALAIGLELIESM